MGKKRILKDGKKSRRRHNQKKKGRKHESHNSTSKKIQRKKKEPKHQKKKKKISSLKDWVTWNRSLITANLEDIRRENITTRVIGSVIVEEIMLEL